MFYLNNTYSILEHRFITAKDSSSEGTWVGYMLWELNLFSISLVICNSMQQIFLTWRKDFRRKMESKVLVCILFAYLSGKLRRFRKYVDSS